MRVPPHGKRAIVRLLWGHMKNPQSLGSKSGTRDQIEGTGKKLTGKVKVGLGKALGSPGLRKSGNRDQVIGSMQKRIGALKTSIAR